MDKKGIMGFLYFSNLFSGPYSKPGGLFWNFHVVYKWALCGGSTYSNRRTPISPAVTFAQK